MNECDESSDVEFTVIEEECRPDNVIRMQKTESQISDSSSDRNVGAFMTGIDIFSKEEKLKMEERAKRFGLTEKFKDSFNREDDLYSSMGITDDAENAKNIRLNVIHMRGTKEMSTKDVFIYFQDYAPRSIEWINDVSCNIVWCDNLSAARAMLGLSTKILGSVGKHSDTNQENDENEKDADITMDEENESTNVSTDGKKENYINIKDIEYPLPPGIWRKGIDYPKSKGIFLRFATKADRKQVNAEKMSEYYKKYGNPNFGGLKGILTESRKRIYKEIRQNKRKLTTEDEEENQTKNPWGALSESWGLNDVVEDDFLPKNDVKDLGRNIKERLGIKYSGKDAVQEEESGEASSSSDNEEDWCKRSKVLRMRMHADDEEEKVQKRRAKLRYQMVLNNLNSRGDLRSRLGKTRTKTQFRDPIQVVVTNTNLTKSNSSEDNNSEAIRGKGWQIAKEAQLSEQEEGEWQESEDEEEGNQEEVNEEKERQRKVVEEEEEQKVEDEEEEEEGEHRKEEDSDLLAKEIQGPKGSVIKVVPPKPRIASTVWARLNRVKSEINDGYLKERRSCNRDLRNTLKGDLRSRIGKHTRGRSPLRIEVKNDKYMRN